MEPWDEKERGYIRWVSRSRRRSDKDVTNAITVWDIGIEEVDRVRKERKGKWGGLGKRGVGRGGLNVG